MDWHISASCKSDLSLSHLLCTVVVSAERAKIRSAKKAAKAAKTIFNSNMDSWMRRLRADDATGRPRVSEADVEDQGEEDDAPEGDGGGVDW